MATPVSRANHYATLGVDKKASVDEIKKAYRKLALIHHPDKNGDPKKFQEISQAYEILSDPDKKRAYDNPMRSFMSSSGGVGGMGGMGMNFGSFPGGVHQSVNVNVNDILSSMFGVPRQDSNRTPDLKHTMSLSLQDMYAGKTCKLAISRGIRCEACKGEGGSGKHDVKCTGCAGRGVRHVHKANTVTRTTCIRCKGEGSTPGFEKVCKACTSRGSIKDRTVVEAVFPPGCSQGHKVIIEGMSDYVMGKESGDVVVSALQKEHPLFKRNGNVLRMSITISVRESLCGFKREITHLDGRILSVGREEGVVTPQGHKITIPGEGIPRNSGVLEITISIDYPPMIPETIRAKLSELFEEMESGGDKKPS